MNLAPQTVAKVHAELGAIGFMLLDVEDHLTALLDSLPVPEGDEELSADDLTVELRGSIVPPRRTPSSLTSRFPAS